MDDHGRYSDNDWQRCKAAVTMASIAAIWGFSYLESMAKNLFWLGLVLSTVVLWGGSSPSFATTMKYKTIRELVRGSDVTLLGQPVGQQSFWQGTRILTRVQVRVQEVWAGSRPEQSIVEVVTAGGVVGAIGQRVDGAAVLPTRGQMVLHLRHYDGEYWPTAMAQGVWVVQGGETSQALLRPGTDRMVFGLRNGRSKEPKTLEALRAAVAEVAREP